MSNSKLDEELLMIELKQELEALADRWHNYIGGGTMTNKEHAKQLRHIISKYGTAKDALDLLTKEEEQVLLEALSSNHRFTETSDPSK